LNQPYRVSLRLEAAHEAVDCRELLGRDATLAIDRYEHRRTLHGIVQRVLLQTEGVSGQLCVVEIVPALSALRFSEDSRIFQDRSAIDIIEEVLGTALRKYDRVLDTADLDR